MSNGLTGRRKDPDGRLCDPGPEVYSSCVRAKPTDGLGVAFRVNHVVGQSEKRTREGEPGGGSDRKLVQHNGKEAISSLNKHLMSTVLGKTALKLGDGVNRQKLLHVK